MKCPRCDVEMVSSKAIKPSYETNVRYLVAQPLVNANTLELIDCLKCPVCGHSDDMK